MQQFLSDLRAYNFLQYAMVTSVLASVACGIVGSYVTVRRITYIAGAIAHCTLGGMGMAVYLQREAGMTWLTPMVGAVIAALIAAIIIGLFTIYGSEREDTVLSAVWAIGMAIGIFFIHKTSGYNEDLMSYLFGNILMVARNDLWLIAILDIAILVIIFLFYSRLLAVSFDEEYARLRGINVHFYYLLLLCLTALTVVLLVQVVGIVMVIALLTLPAAAAAQLTRRLWQTILLAIFITLICTAGGIVVSYGPDLHPGATIVCLAGSIYILVLAGKSLLMRVLRRRDDNVA